MDFFVETKVPTHLWSFFRIVHGICLVPGGDNERFAHAWVERTYNGSVEIIQAGLLEEYKMYFAIPLEVFVDVLRPQRMTRYTILEAAAENDKANHFGPWDPEYISLTREEAHSSACLDQNRAGS
jgi:hypothetical protein